MMVRRIRDKYTIMTLNNFKVVNEDEDDTGDDTGDKDEEAEDMDDTMEDEDDAGDM